MNVWDLRLSLRSGFEFWYHCADQRTPLPPAVVFRDGDDDTQQLWNATTIWSDESATAGGSSHGDGGRGEELAAFGA
jgi:hypothetical protein